MLRRCLNLKRVPLPIYGSMHMYVASRLVSCLTLDFWRQREKQLRSHSRHCLFLLLRGSILYSLPPASKVGRLALARRLCCFLSPLCGGRWDVMPSRALCSATSGAFVLGRGPRSSAKKLETAEATAAGDGEREGNFCSSSPSGFAYACLRGGERL